MSFFDPRLAPVLPQSQVSRISSWDGAHSGLPTALHTRSHTVLANTQFGRIWLIVSSCWSQNGQASWCGRPLRANLSEVQHLFLSTSHTRKRHCSRARYFHVRSAVGATSWHANLATYDDLTKNDPSFCHDHWIESLLSRSSCILATLSQRNKYS